MVLQPINNCHSESQTSEENPGGPSAQHQTQQCQEDPEPEKKATPNVPSAQICKSKLSVS